MCFGENATPNYLKSANGGKYTQFYSPSQTLLIKNREARRFRWLCRLAKKQVKMK